MTNTPLKTVGRPRQNPSKTQSPADRQRAYRKRAKANASAMAAPRFVIFSSYGNDSCALIQYAYENNLEDVAVVYTDTQWSASGWGDRVNNMEKWVGSLGFRAERINSIGFMQLAREKKGFPSQQFQWCSYRLKIEPGMKWLENHDPYKRAICLVGVRREESQSRVNFPSFLLNSGNHGGRAMVAPLVDFTEEDRNAFLKRAGIEPLEHRSRECLCINSNRQDMRQFTSDDIVKISDAETEIGRTLFRPHRHQGATGIHQVMRWAQSDRAKYTENDDEIDEDINGCEAGWCDI